MIFLLLFTLLLPSQAEDYPALAERVRKGDESVDLRQVRFACASDAKCEFAGDTEQKMTRAFAAKRCAEALPLAEKVLENNVVEPHAYFVKFVCHKENGEAEAAEKARLFLVRLMASYTAGDLDGKTQAKAIPVAIVHEEYAFIQLYSLRFKQQALQAVPCKKKEDPTCESGVHSFDAMTVAAEDDKDFTLYFNVDEPMNRLARALKDSDSKPTNKKDKNEKKK